MNGENEIESFAVTRTLDGIFNAISYKNEIIEK